MDNIQKIIKDILYVSKLTGTKNKKLLIFTSIVLSQLTVAVDLLLIAVFASLIADQFTNIELLNNILVFFIEFKIIVLFIVVARYLINYLQFIILKKIELDVLLSLRNYMFGKVLEQKNYSTSDSYYYINTLCGHISFFYSNFAEFLNYLLQAIAYLIYLIFADLEMITFFGIGVLVLGYPIYRLIKASRDYMHKTFIYGRDASSEMVNVVENLSLIKILRMEKYQSERFNEVMKKSYDVIFRNQQVMFINNQLPNMFTLFIFAIILNFENFVSRITLDFLGVTIRLFQSVSKIADSISKVANSQIHIQEFVEIEKGTQLKNLDYFNINESSDIVLKDISFKYLNSDTYIFKNLNLEIKKNTHNIIIGSNGSGKSTLLGLIGNVLRPERGSLTTFSNNFAYIGATPFIFSTSIRDNVLYGNKFKVSDEEVLAYMKKFQVFKEEDSYDLNRLIDNTSLSSGQMQKLAFIRALLSRPEILLLDESIANLDEFSKNLVLEIISKQKITVINSTHDPEKYENIDSVFKLDLVDEERVITKFNQ